MSVLAAGTSPTLLAAVIGAVASVVCALLLAVVAARAQSAHAQLEEIRKLADEFSDRTVREITEQLHELLDANTRALYIADVVRRTLRDVLRETFGAHGGRRHYDPPD